jgi:putative acetyltransferase
MDFTTGYAGRKQAIVDLFRATFTASEGAGEGATIGNFAEALLTSTAAEDIFVFCALDEDRVQACAIFTRLRYPDDDRIAFLLSPMAVRTDQQGKGLGQSLLRFGLQNLNDIGVNVALTYGDIAFYQRVGFRHIPETTAQAPLPLSFPDGWLAQSLTAAELRPLQGRSICVAALNDPALW